MQLLATANEIDGRDVGVVTGSKPELYFRRFDEANEYLNVATFVPPLNYLPSLLYHPYLVCILLHF